MFVVTVFLCIGFINGIGQLRFGIITLFGATSVAALISAFAFGDPVMGTGVLIIVVPTIAGAIVATKMARHDQS